MFVSIFSTTFIWNLDILRRIQRDVIKMYEGLHVNTHYSCKILMKLEISGQISEKYPNIKISWESVQ